MRLLPDIITILTITCLLWFSVSASAAPFQCQITYQKAPCWAKYDIEFRVALASPGKEGDTQLVELDKDTQKITKTVDCEPNDLVHMSASYSPVIWQHKKPQHYGAKQVWRVPTTLKKDKQFWHLAVCFSQDFSSVNNPLNANGSCNCK